MVSGQEINSVPRTEQLSAGAEAAHTQIVVGDSMLQSPLNLNKPIVTDEAEEERKKRIHKMITVMGVILLIMSIVIIIVMFSMSSKINEQVRDKLATTYGITEVVDNATSANGRWF